MRFTGPQFNAGKIIAVSKWNGTDRKVDGSDIVGKEEIQDGEVERH